MTKQSDTAAPLLLSKPADQPKVRRPAKKGNSLATIALLIGLVSIGLQFQSVILSNIQRAADAQPWIRDLSTMLAPLIPKHEAVLTVTASDSTATAGTPASTIASNDEEIRDALAELGQAVDRLDKASLGYAQTENLAALQMQVTEQAQAQATHNADTAQQIDQLASLSADHERRLSVAQQSPMTSLVVARIALAAASGAISAPEVDLLATATASDPALSEPVATLKVLVGQEIPSFAALREQFLAQQEAAMSAARSAKLEWWEAGLSSVQTAASDWGLASPKHFSIDDIAVEKAAHQLDLGDLDGALFELEAASPEMKDALRLWLDQAKLRVTLDETLLQLVDAFIRREGKPSPSASSDG